jgi:predicted nucleotidyltransferase
MKTVGVIAEYNPFHKGHAYHLRAAREATGAGAAAVVMSGNYTQRGEPAAFDKWQRTRWALEAGADLVIELPTAYAVSSAEGFALGAVTLLHRLGAVDFLCFGSETDDLALLERIAGLLAEEPPEFRRHLKRLLSEGHTHARARAIAATLLLDDPAAEKALVSPNAILAVEYLKARRAIGSPLRPVAVCRLSAGYCEDGLDHEMPSATAIRAGVFARGVDDKRIIGALPPHVHASMAGAVRGGFRPVCMDDFSRMVLYSLRRLGKDGIANLGEVAEGLENRIYEACFRARTAGELVDRVSTKRYTRTRLQRILVYALLGIDKATLCSLRFPETPVYARILGFTRTGEALLKKISKAGDIDLVSKTAAYNPGDAVLEKLFAIDVLGTDLYATVQHEPSWRAWGQDFTRPVIKL